MVLNLISYLKSFNSVLCLYVFMLSKSIIKCIMHALEFLKKLACSTRLIKYKMAIFHLNVKTISRGTTSAKSKFCYITRSEKYAKDIDELVAMGAGNMPEWAKENQDTFKKYWECADRFERANGRLCNQIEFALPKELSADQQEELVINFSLAVSSTQDGQLPFTYAVHKGKGENPHCHLMLSERVNDGIPRSPETWFKRASPKDASLGGAKKTSCFQNKNWLFEVRELWSKKANEALQQAGHKEQIDHRSYEEQGKNKTPLEHVSMGLRALIERKEISLEQVEKQHVLKSIANRAKEQEFNKILQEWKEAEEHNIKSESKRIFQPR